MRQELKDLEKIVESQAEKLYAGQEGNVWKTVVKLQSSVAVPGDFKSRFSWGRGKTRVEMARAGEIVAFNFSNAILSQPCARMKSGGRVWRDNCIPLAAFPAEILEKILESAGTL